MTVADDTHMDMSQVIQAQQAAEAEKAMSLGQAMKHFHKGIMWSMLLSFALVMDGYDIVIVSTASTTSVIALTRCRSTLSGVCLPS